MFPGRFPNVPDTMWNFEWNPQALGLPGQFCGGDLMNQQSQAQSQAQTQAQLAALREQNSILNQQLASQAQSHIQHLQQLLPFHQSTPTPHPPQSTPSAPEPPTPVAPQSTPPGPSVSFNAEEMMQQMKNTVESSMQAFVDKNQERNKSHPPLPAQPPVPTSPLIPIHHPPSSSIRWLPTTTPTFPPSLSLSPSRFWSQNTWQTSDLHPTQSPSTKILQTSTSFVSSTPFISKKTLEMLQGVQAELHRSHCVRPLHVVEKYHIEEMMIIHFRNPVTCQPIFTQQRGNTTHNHPLIMRIPSQTTTTMTITAATSGNPGANGKTIPSLHTHPTHRAGLTTPNQHSVTTAITTLTAFSSNHTTTADHADLHTDQAQSNLVAPPPSLQDVLPSISKTARKKNGFDISDMLWTIPTECAQRMSSQLPSVPSLLPLSIKKNTKRLVNNFTKLIKESPRCGQEGGPTLFQHQPSPWLRFIHLPCPWTSKHQQACTRHASTRHQPLPNATSLRPTAQSHLGIVSWNDNPHFSANTPGRQDQTCKLVLSQRPSALSPTNLWGILSWQRSIQQWQNNPTLGRTRTPWLHQQERQGPAGHRRRGDVSRVHWPYCIQSWRQRDGSTWCDRKRNRQHFREVHDCAQPTCGLEIHSSEICWPQGLQEYWHWWHDLRWL